MIQALFSALLEGKKKGNKGREGRKGGKEKGKEGGRQAGKPYQCVGSHEKTPLLSAHRQCVRTILFRRICFSRSTG